MTTELGWAINLVKENIREDTEKRKEILKNNMINTF